MKRLIAALVVTLVAAKAPAQAPVLISTFTNSVPAAAGRFGTSMVALGNDRVLIGARNNATTATNAGAVYLFRVPSLPTAPSLTIQLTSSNIVVASWPLTSTDFVPQQNTNGVRSGNWSLVTDDLEDNGTNKSLIVTPSKGSWFYRLVQP